MQLIGNRGTRVANSTDLSQGEKKLLPRCLGITGIRRTLPTARRIPGGCMGFSEFRHVSKVVRTGIAWAAALGFLSSTMSAQTGPGTSTPAGPRCFAIEVYVPAAALESPDVLSVAATIRSRTGVTLRTVPTDDTPENRQRYQRICDFLKLKPSAGLLIYGCSQGIEVQADPAAVEAALDQMLTMTAFVRSGCPHCAAAKQYLPKLQARYPALRLVYRDLTSDRTAVADLERLVQHYQRRAASVPVLHFCNTLHVGFDSADVTGRALEQTLQLWSRNCPPAKTAYLDIAPPSAVQYVVFLAEDSGEPPIEATLPEPDELPLPLPLPLAPDDHQDASADDSGELPTAAKESDSQVIELPVFGHIDARALGLPMFTLAVGLVDGFNPCAMWVLLFLLSILVNLKDRGKILAVAGTFVVISGLAYFAFMAAWLNVFRLIGLLRSAQVALGLLALVIGAVHIKDFFAFKQGISLSIPESAKPGIYARVRKIITAEHLYGAILGAATLAVLVNVVELLCTAGLPAMYTQILTMQQLPTWQEYAYLGLYILAYMFDDSLMVGVVVVTLGKRKLQEHEGRWLKLISGLVILCLGVVMIFKPEWLV